MVDVKANALRMIAEGMPRFMVAAKSGTTEDQIKEWEQEEARSPVLKMLNDGMTPSEIGRKLKCSPDEARRLIVSAWKKEKDDFTAESTRRAVWGDR